MDSAVHYPVAVRLARAVHNAFSAWLILGLSLLLTVGAYYVSEQFVQKRAEDQFNFRTRELEDTLTTRMYLYEQLLWSGAALMNASDHISREDFQLFVKTMDIERRWPGIQGYGFSLVVPADQYSQHVQEIRAEGYPQYTIKPDGERELYTAIIYLEPFDWRNQRAFGYDMFSNPVRREAMELARDTGSAATSGMITLVQETKEDVQKGFLTYVPVYKSKTLPATLAERRAQLRGWVYAPFRMGNLMAGILAEHENIVQFEIYDGVEARAENLLYSSAGRSFERVKMHRPQFSKTIQFNLQGHPWLLVMSTPELQRISPEQALPRYVALGGIIVDLLLFYVIFSLHFINRRAESLAEAKTVELEQAKLSLEAQVQARTAELKRARDDLEKTILERTQLLQEKLDELAALNTVTVGREERILSLKAEVNDLSIKLGKEPPYESVR